MYKRAGILHSFAAGLLAVMVCCFAGCNKQPANTESNSSGISSADAILSSDMNAENSKSEENSTVSNLSSKAAAFFPKTLLKTSSSLKLETVK